MTTSSGQNVFLADLHHPGGAVGEIEQLLAEIPGNTRRVFLLGDIFQFWVNDPDFMETKYSVFLDQLRNWAKEGIQLFFLEGNRDFLASHYFENEPWIDVLANPSVIDVDGRAVYIGHGDELCWNDWAYQLYKTFIRSRAMRVLADRLPAVMRRAIAHRMEQASNAIVAGKKESTLAVPHRAYESVIASGIDAIVHGHVHQTYQREYTVNGRTGQVYAFGWKDGKRNLIHFAG
jgi:UDP-2,3-diacylglucosamine hydrolase